MCPGAATQDNWNRIYHMRSSKNRSRSKGNRNRSVGNIVNRVFESSGPEGKVRGTPQQIIDKYNQLTRDAQLSNDRVAAENFAQHAEHYLRMLAEAQREQDARQPQPQQQQGGGGRDRDGDDRDDGGNDQQGRQQSDQGGRQHEPANRQHDHGNRQPDQQNRQQDQPARQQDQGARPQPREARGEFDAVIDTGDGSESGLVETPETAPKPKRSRTRRPRKAEDGGQQSGNGDGADKSAGGDDAGGSSGSPQEAAE